MNAYVEIRLRNSALRDVTDPVLAGLPLRDGQYFEAEMRDVEDGEDDSIITLDLGEYADLSAGQEQFLNANDAVREYAVRDNLTETHARSCPNCGSHNIQMTGVSSASGTDFWDNVKCERCGYPNFDCLTERVPATNTPPVGVGVGSPPAAIRAEVNALAARLSVLPAEQREKLVQAFNRLTA